jgi:hypothetical protein
MFILSKAKYGFRQTHLALATCSRDEMTSEAGEAAWRFDFTAQLGWTLA